MSSYFFVKTSQLTTRVSQLQGDYDKLIDLIRALKNGDISIDDVTVTDENGWNYTPPGAPSTPAAVVAKTLPPDNINPCERNGLAED